MNKQAKMREIMNNRLRSNYEKKHTIKSNNTETLRNTLHQIEKLEADKAELLEALEKARIALKKWDDELSYDIYDLIQKMKQ